jgi:hypothetical protein
METSIKKDWLIAISIIVGFFVILKGAGWVDDKFEFAAIFNIVDFYAVAAKVAIASALAWSVKRFVFSHTLGKDFGDTFDSGWGSMTSIEKTRWILGVFVAIFTTIMFNL